MCNESLDFVHHFLADIQLDNLHVSKWAWLLELIGERWIKVVGSNSLAKTTIDAETSFLRFLELLQLQITVPSFLDRLNDHYITADT